MNECGSCKRDFGSVTAFDMHRVGKHEYLADAEHPDGRRCLTPEEMVERGMREDKNGRWRSPFKGTPWWTRAEDSAAA